MVELDPRVKFRSIEVILEMNQMFVLIDMTAKPPLLRKDNPAKTPLRISTLRLDVALYLKLELTFFHL